MDEKVLGILAKAGKAMTNYEAMRLMDKDELVEFLSSIMDGKAMRTMDKDDLAEFLLSIVDCGAIRIMDKDELANFLLSIVDCKKCPASEKFCDGQRDCDDAILNWLNAESDDDIVVEHSDGKTINISHANVVFFD